MPRARLTGTFSSGDPDAAVVDPVGAAVEFSDLATERLRKPRERRSWIARDQADVMQARLLRVLHDVDQRSPRIDDLRHLHPIHRHRRHDDLYAGSLQLLDGAVDVGHREPDQAEDAAGAWLWTLSLPKDEPRSAQHRPIGAFRCDFGVEVGVVPLDGFGLIARRKMDVVDQIG